MKFTRDFEKIRHIVEIMSKILYELKATTIKEKLSSKRNIAIITEKRLSNLIEHKIASKEQQRYYPSGQLNRF